MSIDFSSNSSLTVKFSPSLTFLGSTLKEVTLLLTSLPSSAYTNCGRREEKLDNKNKVNTSRLFNFFILNSPNYIIGIPEKNHVKNVT